MQIHITNSPVPESISLLTDPPVQEDNEGYWPELIQKSFRLKTQQSKKSGLIVIAQGSHA